MAANPDGGSAQRSMRVHRARDADKWALRLEELRLHLTASGGAYPESSTPLAEWIRVQRRAFKHAMLSPECRAALEALPGWTWNASEDRWAARPEELQDHLSTAGAYPAYRTSLGQWVKRQRLDFRNGTMTAERRALLEALPGWTWTGELLVKWPDRFEQLHRHLTREGTYPPSKSPLGDWIKNQRRSYKHGTMPAERRALLEALPGWTWTGELLAKWPVRFEQLHRHLAREGTYPPSKGPLGEWIKKQRHAYKQGTMPAERRALLEALPGWKWSTLDYPIDLAG